LQRRTPTAPLLQTLTDATTYYHGHDDWYFVLESRTDRLPRLVLRRLLANRAALAWRPGTMIVPDPDDELAETLLDYSREWAGEIFAM
jgi:hypothetical protein